MPADFFRTMEDASGMDLDWFWRGWFYSTDHVDIAVTSVKQLNVSTSDPVIEKQIKKEKRDAEPETLSKQRNKDLKKRTADFPELKDFYNEFDPLDVTSADTKAFKKFLDGLDDDQKKMLAEKRNFYLIDFENVGGLVMPIIFDAIHEDGSKQRYHVPAEIWSRNNQQVSRLLMSDKVITAIELDPQLETADSDLSNNYFPPRISQSRFELFKRKQEKNDMQKAKAMEEGDEEEDDSDKEDE